MLNLQRLEALRGGSVRRLLALQEGGGIALQAKIDKVFASLPGGDLKAAHMLSDELAPAAAEQKFALFYELFLGTLQRLVKAAGDRAGQRRPIWPAPTASSGPRALPPLPAYGKHWPATRPRPWRSISTARR